MSELKVDKITPRQGTTLTLGDSGDTINFGSGVLPNFENLTVTGDFTVDTNSLKVDSTNNRVGIGTASPSVALDVVGAITASGNITGTLATAAQPNITSLGTLTGLTTTGDINLGDSDKINLGASNDLQIFHDGSNSNISDVGTGQLVLRTDGTQVAINKGSSENMAKFIVDGACELYHDNSKKFETLSSGANITGSLGIGTSSPDAKVHAESSATTKIKAKTTTSTAIGGLEAHGNSTSYLKIFQLGSSYGGTTFGGVTGNNQALIEAQEVSSLAFTTQGGTPDIIFAPARTARMTIKNGGNVGIGNDTSGFNAQADNLVVGTGSGANGITIYSGSDSTGDIFFSDGTSGDDPTRGGINYSHSNNSMNFRVNDSPRMYILSGGNVGIGTSSPSAQFHVIDDDHDGITAKFVNNNAGNSGADIDLIKDSSSPADSDNVGTIRFKANDDGGTQRTFASIQAVTEDASAGSSDVSLRFSIRGNASTGEAMRMNSSGALSIGSTANSGYKLKVDAQGDSLGAGYMLSNVNNQPSFEVTNTNTSDYAQSVLWLQSNRSTANGSYNFLRCIQSGVTDKCFIRDSGNLANANNVYGGISDLKLKEQITDSSSQWSDIKNIQIKKFKYKHEVAEGDSNSLWKLGVIAQEIETISPSLVETVKDIDKDGNAVLDDEGNETYTKNVKYSVLYMKAVKALQEAMQKIENLESRMETLENA